MSAATAAAIPVGSRVVLVEDHRSTPLWGAKGWRGVVVMVDERHNGDDGVGRYRIEFDDRRGVLWVNASAIALESPADTLTPWERDTALAMAIGLAEFMTQMGHDGISDKACSACAAHWLRDCVRRDLEAQ